MTTVLITGSAGFIGKHLAEALGRIQNLRTIEYEIGNSREDLDAALNQAAVIFHLAGVNRPKDPAEFRNINAGLTEQICSRLESLGRSPLIVLASSVQAELENPYGISKREAEETLRAWSKRTGGRFIIFRLKNVFGKWCRPNYNSVTATFCQNIAHDLPITVSDPTKELELVYIDDVVAAFLATLNTPPTAGFEFREVPQSFKVTLGELASKIRSFRESRTSLLMPDLEDRFTRCLYATYQTYLDGPDFAYGLDIKRDKRGELAEFLKSAQFGQIFVSRTKPGIVRGNHYHHTKAEKFLVLEGDAIIRFRHVHNKELIEHKVSGKEFKVVDIPPGYAHSIENVGTGEMVVLFWASEIFNPEAPETYGMEVVQ